MKKLIYSFIVLFLVFSGALKADISTGLVAHFEFEGNVTDSTGTNDGTASGTLTYTTGKIGQAASFSGDDYITLADMPTILGTAETTTTAWSQCSWVYVNDNTNGAVITDYYSSGGTSDEDFGVYTYFDPAGGYKTAARVNPLGTRITSGNLDTASAIDTGWKHICVTVDKSTGVFKSYLDGAEVQSYTNIESSANYFDATGSTYIGAANSDAPNAPNQWFLTNALVDDVRIYNRALTGMDIIELYKYDPTPKLTLKAHGGTVQFDGNSTNYVNIGDITDLNNASKYTIEAWVNTAQIGNSFTIFEKTYFDVSNTVVNAVVVQVQSDGQVSTSIVTNGQYKYAISTTSLTPNNWYHIAAVYDSTAAAADKLKVYINGVKETASQYMEPLLSTTPDLSGVNAHIGTEGKWPVYHPNMQMDEVRVWNIARNQTEIIDSMNQQLDGNETGLVAYYNFDERLGDTVKDISGNGNDGTFDGNVTRLNFLGDSLSFDGSTSYIDLGSSSILKPTNELSLGLWFEYDGTVPSSYISLISNTQSGGYGLDLAPTGNLRAVVSNGAYQTAEYSQSLLNIGWNHASFSYDQTNGIKLYVNGELVHSNSSVGAIAHSTSNTFIGAEPNGSTPEAGRYYSGKIAEVSIWNKALSANEVKNIMASSLNGDETGLVGYWPLNEVSGATTAYDKTTNINNGTITGATWVNSAPTIYGDTIYTAQDIISNEKLIVENNSTTPTYSYNGTAPSEILSFGSSGDFLYKNGYISTDTLDINANDNGTTLNNVFDVVVYQNPNYHRVDISLENVNLTDHNITSATLLKDDNLYSFTLSDIYNGTNSLTMTVKQSGDYLLKFLTSDGQEWYYNFTDSSIDLANDGTINYKTTISTNVSYTISATKTNWENRPPKIIDDITFDSSPTVIAGTGPSTAAVDTLDATSKPINGVYDIQVENDGTIYVDEYNGNKLFKVSPSGELNVSNITDVPTFFEVLSDGRAYTYHRAGKVIQEVDISTMTIGSSLTLTGDSISGTVYAATNKNNYLYLGTDTGNIYKVNVDTNVSTKIAGAGSGTTCTDVANCLDGNATSYDLGAINTGMDIDSNGNIYFTEHSLNRVRKIDTNGNITTIAGNGTASTTGDGGLAINATLNSPRGLSVDSDGNIYVVELTGNVVRKIDSDGYISTVISGLSTPNAIDTDSDGNIYLYNGFNTSTDSKILKYNSISDYDVTVLENSTTVVTVNTIDLDNDSMTYTISGTDASLFSIDTSGNITFNSAPDYESPKDTDSNNIYEFIFSVGDGYTNISKNVIVTVTDDPEVVSEDLGTMGIWNKAQYYSNYQSNTLVDNGTYTSMSVSKISGTQSILALYKNTADSLTMKMASMDVDLTSIDASTFLIFKAIDTNEYTHQILINSQQALASIFAGSEEIRTESIFNQDTTNPFLSKRVKLNIWAQNGTTYFNITDVNNNQIGKTIQLYSVGVEGFISYGIEAILDSNSSLNIMKFDFHGITDSQTLSNTYNKRFPAIDRKITTAIYDSAIAIDPNGKVWYDFEANTYNSDNEYFNLKVGQINPVETTLNETEVIIDIDGIIKSDKKEQNTIGVSSNIISFSSDEGDEEVKYIGTLNSTDLNTLLTTVGLDTSFSFSGTAIGHKLYLKRKTTSCEIHYIDSFRTDYIDTDDIIFSYSYNSNNTFQNFITHNEYNNLKVLAFSDTTPGDLVEVSLVDNAITQTNAGTSSIVSGVTCTKEDGSSVVLDIIDLEPTVDGYEYSDIGYKDGVKYNVEYQKAGDAYEIVLFNEEAINQLLSHFGVNGTPVKEKTLTDVYTYLSFPSNILLCSSELQSILTDCNQHHTLESVFGGVDALFKYTGFWSYWKKNITNATNNYNMDLLSSIDNKEGFIVKTSSVQTLKIPYNLFGTIEGELIELYQNGWFLTSSHMDRTTTNIENMVKSQGKSLRYMLHLNNNIWNVHAPLNDGSVDSSLPRMNNVKEGESFWIYVE